MNLMTRDHNFDKNVKKLTAKSAKPKSVKTSLCVNVKHSCEFLYLCMCLTDRNSEAIYQQLHFQQRLQCCSFAYKLLKMYEKMR